MASVSNRWETVLRICELVGAHELVGDCAVWPVWPGDKLVTPEMIVGDVIEGEETITSIVAPRQHRDDRFTVTFQMSVASHKDSYPDAMVRVFELVSMFQDVMAESPTLDDLDGIVSAMVGPSRQWPIATPEGAIAAGEVTVSVHSYLD